VRVKQAAGDGSAERRPVVLDHRWVVVALEVDRGHVPAGLCRNEPIEVVLPPRSDALRLERVDVGLGEGQRIANLANLYYIPFAPHMVASYLGAMASCHVCASVPNFLILEWQSYFHTDPMFKEIIKYDGEWVKDSFITISEKPGIGVEINEEGMKKYAIPNVPFFA